MPTIKFSNPPLKLYDADGYLIKTAKLLLVTSVHIDDVRDNPAFIDYETDNKYILPYSEFYTVLIFLIKPGEIFTELRPSHSRHGSTKDYYKQFVGQKFQIEIRK